MGCVVMPKHCDLDFPHAPVWCDDCRSEARQYEVIFEMRRGNDLKQRELDFREVDGEWIKPEPRRRSFILPPPAPNKPKEGFVEPRRDERT